MRERRDAHRTSVTVQYRLKRDDKFRSKSDNSENKRFRLLCSIVILYRGIDIVRPCQGTVIQDPSYTYNFMPIQTVPLTLPPSADPSKFTLFGREVIDVDPGNLSSAEFAEIEQLLYTVSSTPKVPHPVPDPIPFQHDALLFRNANFSPEQQYAFTRVSVHAATTSGSNPGAMVWPPLNVLNADAQCLRRPSLSGI